MRDPQRCFGDRLADMRLFAQWAFVVKKVARVHPKAEGTSVHAGDGIMQTDSAVEPVLRMPYHEFYLDDFEPRPHYRPLWEHVRHMGQHALATKAQELQLAMRTEGITFAVYSETEQGIERVWPFDLIPRIIPTAEWAILEAGLKQRVRALNLFLKDIYHEQRILKDGVISAQLIYQGKHFRQEIVNIDPPHDIYTHISGIDIIRNDDGRYLILEDNLRTPSGVSWAASVSGLGGLTRGVE